MSFKTILATILIVLSLSSSAWADQGEKETPERPRRWNVIDGANRVYTRVGIDPALGMALGYARELDFADTGRNWLLFGDFSTPFVSFGRSGALEPGAYLPIVRYKLFRFSTEATFELGWTRNRNYNSVRLAPGLGLLPGIGGKDNRWYVDAIFAYERAIANHIVHTDFYREVFYEDAKDGWYYGTGSRFRMGLRVGFRINRFDLELRAAHDRTERFRFAGGSPVAATLGFGARI